MPWPKTGATYYYAKYYYYDISDKDRAIKGLVV